MANALRICFVSHYLGRHLTLSTRSKMFDLGRRTKVAGSGKLQAILDIVATENNLTSVERETGHILYLAARSTSCMLCTYIHIVYLYILVLRVKHIK